MSVSRTVCVVVLGGLLVGCQPPPKPATPPEPQPATEDVAAHVAAIFQQQDPSARVGVVLATLPSSNTAAVRADALSGIVAGNPVSFTNSAGSVIANGTVQSIDRGYLIVSYDASGGRAPQAGDLAVAFQPKSK